MFHKYPELWRRDWIQYWTITPQNIAIPTFKAESSNTGFNNKLEAG